MTSSEPLFDSKAFLSAVTHQSGVYRMYDSGGTVIYVGKAKDLKNGSPPTFGPTSTASRPAPWCARSPTCR